MKIKNSLNSLVILVVLSFVALSCGRNAFIETIDDGVTQRSNANAGGNTGGDTGDDPENCTSQLYTVTPIPRDFVEGEQPFTFQRIRLGQHNHVIDWNGTVVNRADLSQVVLDYDLSPINNLDKKIKSIRLRFTADQYSWSKDDLTIRSQICHNHNYVCSGDEQSIDRFNRHSGYEWIDHLFSEIIEGFEMTSPSNIYNHRHVDTSFNLMPMFKRNHNGDLSTRDLKNEYTIFVSDQLMMSKARLNILYCK